MATLERRTRAGRNPIKVAWMITDMSTKRSEWLPNFTPQHFPSVSGLGWCVQQKAVHAVRKFSLKISAWVIIGHKIIPASATDC